MTPIGDALVPVLPALLQKGNTDGEHPLFGRFMAPPQETPQPLLDSDWLEDGAAEGDGDHGGTEDEARRVSEGMERSALHRKLKSLGVHGSDKPGNGHRPGLDD